jgi:hypothetical protein
MRLHVLRRIFLALGLIALLPVRASAADPLSLDVMLPGVSPLSLGNW